MVCITVYEHHRLPLAFLSLHQTASQCKKGKNEGPPGDSEDLSTLDREKDFISGVVYTAQSAMQPGET